MKNSKTIRTYGTILIWIGALVWVPYFGLRFAGESPSMLLFLPFHLAGVVGGARLRAVADKQMGKPRQKRKGYKLVAHILTIASIFVWLPYYGLKLAGYPVELRTFLVIHLIGIFSGTGLMVGGSLVQFIQNKRAE